MHLGVDEPNDPETFAFQPPRAGSVVLFLVGVSVTVNFDNEAGRRAEEVNDVATDRLLSPELQTPQVLSAQMTPEFLLGNRKVLSESARMDLGPMRDASQSPVRHNLPLPLSPSPKGRGKISVLQGAGVI